MESFNVVNFALGVAVGGLLYQAVKAAVRFVIDKWVCQYNPSISEIIEQFGEDDDGQLIDTDESDYTVTFTVKNKGLVGVNVERLPTVEDDEPAWVR